MLRGGPRRRGRSTHARAIVMSACAARRASPSPERISATSCVSACATASGHTSSKRSPAVGAGASGHEERRGRARRAGSPSRSSRPAASRRVCSAGLQVTGPCTSASVSTPASDASAMRGQSSAWLSRSAGCSSSCTRSESAMPPTTPSIAVSGDGRASSAVSSRGRSTGSVNAHGRSPPPARPRMSTSGCSRWTGPAASTCTIGLLARSRSADARKPRVARTCR